jgi:MarR family transcriptional regulator, transcriptional regulator for hemolysin
MRNPLHNISFLIGDTARLLRRRFEQKAKGHSLSRAQWQVLASVQRYQGIHQHTLADLMEMKPITLVRLLDKLQEAGLIERRIDEHDRRARRLYLTAQADPTMTRLHQLADEMRADAFAGLSAAEQTQLAELLLKIRTNLSTPGDLDPKASC